MGTPRLHIKIASRFREVFGYRGDIRLYYAPGRITISGEHIDYSGGKTITSAIDRGIYIVARKRSDKKVNLYSQTFKTKKNFFLDNIKKEQGDEWGVYAKGVALTLKESGYNIMGMDIFIHTEIPFHASLASSTAFSLCLTNAFLGENNYKDISWQDLAVISYKGETKFASQKTSITDHATMIISKKDMLNVFDMSSMEYEYVDFDMKDCSIALVNSNKKRMSSDNEYNSRKRECESALKKIKEHDFKIKNLASIKSKELLNFESFLTSKELRRVKYVVEENERVSLSLKAIKKSSAKDLSNILLKTHKDLSTLYEVSVLEVDILVEEAMKIEGVIGARMAGNGFGGGVLMFFKNSEVENIVEELYLKYKESTKHDADIYIIKPSNGATVFEID